MKAVLACSGFGVCATGDGSSGKAVGEKVVMESTEHGVPARDGHDPAELLRLSSDKCSPRKNI